MSDLNKLKELLNIFIDQELIQDDNSYIFVFEFIKNFNKFLINYNLIYTSTQITRYILNILQKKLQNSNYKSYIRNNTRIYIGFKWKNEHIINDNFIKNNDLNILKNNIENLNVTFTKFNQNILNELNIIKQMLDIKTLKNNKIEERDVSININESLNLNKLKDDTYTINEFIDEFVDYDENISDILYLNTILDDYIQYTGSTIHRNPLSKILNKYLQKKYNNKIEIKKYQDRRYGKGLYYKKEK